MSATKQDDYKEICAVIQHYIDGAISGQGALMKPAFHEQATVYGYVGTDLFEGPIQKLFDWNDANGPAKNLSFKIVNLDVVDTIGSVKIELWNWTGHRFTDIFNLLKIDNQWKVMNKVFHLHST